MKMFKTYFELFFWIISLILLAIMPPGTDVHYSLCIFKLIGINICPGCGIGHSISLLFHGDMQASFSAHSLGIFGLVVIFYRIYKLFLFHFISKKINNYAIR